MSPTDCHAFVASVLYWKHESNSEGIHLRSRRTTLHRTSLVVLIAISLWAAGFAVVATDVEHVSYSSLLSVGNSAASLEECTSVIVTGTAAKDGRAILMKNRDTSEVQNIPVYAPATDESFAFVAVNSMWMGINEKGLAVMNTAMPTLSASPNSGSYNGALNRKILETCQNVADVEARLKAKDSPLLPDPGMPELSVATCVGVIDCHGVGAFFEIGDAGVFAEYVVNGYQSRANHPRVYPGLASGPNGRDQYALDALDAIIAEKGVISWQDVAQEVSRCVRGKEMGSSEFGIGGEVCNDYTASAMVAVSGDSRYYGRLNVMWGEYGLVPIVGVFLPSFVYAGAQLPVLGEMVNHTGVKQDYACPSGEGIYSPAHVREIQNYSFAAEDYTYEQYDRLVDLIPDGLSDIQLRNTLDDFVRLTVSVAVDMYVNVTAERPPYAIPFVIDEVPSVTSTTTGASTSSTTSETDTSDQERPPIPVTAMFLFGFTSGIFAVLVVFWSVESRHRPIIQSWSS